MQKQLLLNCLTVLMIVPGTAYMSETTTMFEFVMLMRLIGEYNQNLMKHIHD